MKPHPASDIFPMMPKASLEALAADIKANGLQEKIIRTKEGMILDGRYRLKACRLAGIEPEFVTWKGDLDKALEFVLSKNIHRRQLSESQRALAAAASMPLIKDERMAAKPEAHLPPGKRRPQTRDIAAKLFGVSARSVQHAAAQYQSESRTFNNTPSPAHTHTNSPFLNHPDLHRRLQDHRESPGPSTPGRVEGNRRRKPITPPCCSSEPA